MLEKVATIKLRRPNGCDEAKEREPCRELSAATVNPPMPLVTRMDLLNRVGTDMLPSASLLLQDTCLNFFADEHKTWMRARHEVARNCCSPSDAQTIAELWGKICVVMETERERLSAPGHQHVYHLLDHESCRENT